MCFLTNFSNSSTHWRPLRLAMEIRAWYVVDKLLEKQVNSKDLVHIKKYIKEVFAHSESSASG